MEGFTVRRAKANDMKHVREMIQELADFEEMGDGPSLSVEELIRDGGFDGGQEFFHCYVAEQADQTLREGLVGYAICFFSYSRWQEQSYFLEDLYVTPAFRSFGVGRLLFEEVVRNAQMFNCKSVNFHVLKWNPAKTFYEKLGAINKTVDGWHYWRLDDEALNKLIQEQNI